MERTADRPRIAYDRVGSAGPRVLLIMGFGMRGDVWQPQLEDLGRDHRLAYFDNRGVGESEPGGRTCTIRDMAEDARRVMDAIGWDRAHVVGVSMGGMVAQELALAHPERVQSLALIATHPGGPLHWFPTLEGVRCFLRAQSRDPERRLEALQDLLHPREFTEQHAPGELAERMRRVGRRAPGRTLLAQLSAVLRHDTRARLGEIRSPTLVVRPGKDILVRPHQSDLLVARIPGARMLRLDDAGHGAIFQCRHRINAALREHFAAAEAPVTTTAA